MKCYLNGGWSIDDDRYMAKVAETTIAITSQLAKVSCLQCEESLGLSNVINTKSPDILGIMASDELASLIMDKTNLNDDYCVGLGAVVDEHTKKQQNLYFYQHFTAADYNACYQCRDNASQLAKTVARHAHNIGMDFPKETMFGVIGATAHWAANADSHRIGPLHLVSAIRVKFNLLRKFAKVKHAPQEYGDIRNFESDYPLIFHAAYPPQRQPAPVQSYLEITELNTC